MLLWVIVQQVQLLLLVVKSAVWPSWTPTAFYFPYGMVSETDQKEFLSFP